jgi:hypothetical protein
MKKLLYGLLCAVGVAAVLQYFSSKAHAVDTIKDWTGENNTMSAIAPDNDYGRVSIRTVGGQVQSKVNFSGQFPNINEHHVYFSDPTLEGALDFKSELHMSGTITFNSPQETIPNFCFCWYNSGDTNHRIGLGISNLNPPEGDFLRIDFGYAATGGNRFYFVTADGTADQTGTNAILQSGTYPFTFDYVPGLPGMAGGMMSATVGNYFRIIQPLETQPWDSDTFTFDRLGILQRSTGNLTFNGFYDVFFSNVTYTGGTEVPEPSAGLVCVVAVIVTRLRGRCSPQRSEEIALL